MPALYNEIDPAAIAVLQHLIAEDVIAPGVVDGRSIKDLKGSDLEGYEQVHLFAGGGLWSVAARLARWPDNRPVWTCSCPCQPWSAAGRQKGVDDPRHLWPDVFRLLGEAGDDRPEVIVGEQVSGQIGYGWLDGVIADLESENYTCWAVDIPACADDAPHQRPRIYWWALDNTVRIRWQQGRDGYGQHDGQVIGATDQHHRADEELADATSQRRQEGLAAPNIHRRRRDSAGNNASDQPRPLGDSIGEGLERHSRDGDRDTGRQEPDRPVAEADGGSSFGLGNRPAAGLRQRNTISRSRIPSGGPVVRGQTEPLGHDNGTQQRQQSGDFSKGGRWSSHPDEGRNGTFWSDAEWIICHDGKARRTKPGLRLLVDGFPGRVDLWRIGGNAIVPQLAAEVIAAVAETIEEEMRRTA